MLEELKGYVGFGADDARLLREAQEQVTPYFESIVEAFYDAIRKSPKARAVFEDDAQIERQKRSLRDWLRTLFGGEYDAAYLTQRERIGRAHVRVGLEQRFMFAAMNVVRAGLHDAIEGQESSTPAQKLKIHSAIDKICDIELAIMLETYRNAYMERIQIGERLAALGQIAGAIAHDLRNPLAVIDTSAHLLQKRTIEEPKVAKHVDRIAHQVTLIDGIITSLLSLTRDELPERQPTVVTELIQDAIDQVRLPTGVTWEADIAHDLDEVLLEPTQIRQVLYNLFKNAAEALRLEGGSIHIRAERDGDSLKLTVSDTGPGLSEEIRETLFHPLVTTKTGGFGLGLALCRYVVEKHAGTITGTNRPEGGALFDIVVPDAIPPS